MNSPAQPMSIDKRWAWWIPLTLVLCVIAGWAVPGAGYLVPSLLALGIVGLVGAILLFALFGIEAGILVGAVVTAFLLMQRFDEGLAIPVGRFAIRGFYIIATLQLAGLFLMVATRNVLDTVSGREGRTFAARFMGLWMAFVIAGTFTIILNSVFNIHVPVRRLTGELLAWYAIIMPMLFLPLAMAGKISRGQIFLALHALVALGGLAGLILAAFGILPGQVLAMLGWSGTIQGTADLVRGRLPMGHPNHVAAVMNMLLPIAIVYGFLGKHLMLRLFHLACALLMLCGVLFALSRGALLNLAIVAGLSLAYVFLTRENRRWYTPFLMAGAMGVCLVIPAVLFQTFDFSRFWSRGYYEDASVERRAESMRTAFEVWKDHPIRGVSPNAVYPRLELRPQWEPAFGDSISPVIFYKKEFASAETPHNLFLIVPAEVGLIGAALFFGILAYMALVLWRARRLPGVSVGDRRMIAAFLISLAGAMLSGLFESILFVGMRVNVVFWVLFGLALVFTFQAVERRATPDEAPPV